MNSLACCYEHGEGVEQNMTEAIRWYTAAAEGGNADDMYELGWQYDHGEGVEQNEDRALYWYRRSAEGGHGGATVDHPRLKVMRICGVQNWEEAVKW